MKEVLKVEWTYWERERGREGERRQRLKANKLTLTVCFAKPSQRRLKAEHLVAQIETEGSKNECLLPLSLLLPLRADRFTIRSFHLDSTGSSLIMTRLRPSDVIWATIILIRDFKWFIRSFVRRVVVLSNANGFVDCNLDLINHSLARSISSSRLDGGMMMIYEEMQVLAIIYDQDLIHPFDWHQVCLQIGSGESMNCSLKSIGLGNKNERERTFGFATFGKASK